MDPSILHLFTSEEIFDRLGQKKCTGCLHLFTPRESVNIFLKDGVVVAAANGALEGVDVLKKVLDWKDARAIWQSDINVASTPFKPLQIPLREFLAQRKQASDPLKKNGADTPQPNPAASEPMPIFKTIPAKGKATGQLSALVSPDQPSLASFHATQPVPVVALPSGHTATKNFNSAPSPSAHDSALLHKHKLALVAVDNKEQRFRLTRVSGLVGRNPACDFPIPHPSVSRQHCLLQILDRGLNVKDLGTTNGTKVNGIPLTEGYVNIGDRLMIGHLTFVVEKDAAGD